MFLWLLNATTETQRKGLADYFQPTIATSRISGGRYGMLAGDSLFFDEGLAHNSASVVILQTDEDGSASSEDANAQNIAENPLTLDSITLEIAHMGALSDAVEITLLGETLF